jgi:hypothetical protein
MTLEQAAIAAAPLVTAFVGAVLGVPKMRRRQQRLERALETVRRKLERLEQANGIEVTNPGFRNPLLPEKK